MRLEGVSSRALFLICEGVARDLAETMIMLVYFTKFAVTRLDVMMSRVIFHSCSKYYKYSFVFNKMVSVRVRLQFCEQQHALLKHLLAGWPQIRGT